MSLAQGNIREDFFDQNSELTILSEVKKLLETEDKKEASKIMWAIYLLEDPNSIFYKMPREERIEEVNREFYKLDMVKHAKLIEQYNLMALTKEEIIFKSYADTMHKLASKLNELDLDSDSGLRVAVSILDKFPKIWDGFEKVKAKMKDASSKTQIKANAKEGAREQRKRKGSGRTEL